MVTLVVINLLTKNKMHIKTYTIGLLLLVSLTSSKLAASSYSLMTVNDNNNITTCQEYVYRICDVTKVRNLTQDELNGAPIFLDNDTKLIIPCSEEVYFGERITFSPVSSDTSILSVDYTRGLNGMTIWFNVSCTPVSGAVGQATVTITSNGGKLTYVINVIDPNSNN